MNVTLHHCGPPANQSEIRAFNRLKGGLASLPGEGHWVLLTNLTFSVTDRLQSDEIDIVAIGPPGVRVIEVKHWTDAHRHHAARAADLLTMKARRIGTTLRNVVPSLPHVEGAILITRPPSRAVRLLGGGMVRGVRICALKSWREVLGADARAELSQREVAALARRLKPRRPVGDDGSLRRLASYINLERQTPPEHTFHRIYKGIHSTTRDRVLLHLYDFSAGEGGQPVNKARREFDALHRLQRHSWAPRIYDSFQNVPGYRDEMSFFSVVDPAAPSISKRTKDDSWTVRARLDFAGRAARALGELHEVRINGEAMLHRNLSPETILVMHDNTPVFTGFDRAKIPPDAAPEPEGVKDAGRPDAVPPEIRRNGIGAASPESDIYSLCASLQVLFSGPDADGQSRAAAKALETGLAEAPGERARLSDLDRRLAELLGKSVPQLPAPSARFWTEDQVVCFRGRKYRIVARLGSRGSGTAFKVVELDGDTAEEVGTFVAKVAHNQADGDRARRCYQLARDPVSRQPRLSSVFEVATEWKDNAFVALLTWIDGSALVELTGVVPLLAEDHRTTAQGLLIRWLRAMCEALDALHRNGLIHGDVSPRNMIVSGEDLVLTDYDGVARIGEPRETAGTTLYSSPSSDRGGEATPSDDLHALAASFFHVLFEKEPFVRDGGRILKGALNWGDTDRAEYPQLMEFFERAVHPDPEQGLVSAVDALKVLSPTAEPDAGDEEEAGSGPPPETMPAISQRSRNEAPWLRDLLASFPGSRWGNRETRGLDSDFAERTYVETELEDQLVASILNRTVRLVILCGNAGDGKTALLQYLARNLEMGKPESSQRVVDQVIGDGLRVRMNLDGSAAYQGRSADEMLDEFLEPFREGPPDENIAHLLAVNDGRLLEWIDRPPDTPLKASLRDFIEATLAAPFEVDVPSGERHIAFHQLNQRSRVGSVARKNKSIETTFLERLLDLLYGGERARKMWRPCETCSAQESCEVFRAATVFGPGDLPGAKPEAVRKRARERLFSAMQAVHFRGEVHITVRELRSALVYILFGTRYCTDYHELSAAPERPYWERAFAPDSPRRQGEVLKELVHLDPALEAHPKIDRHLLRRAASHSGGSSAPPSAGASPASATCRLRP